MTRCAFHLLVLCLLLPASAAAEGSAASVRADSLWNAGLRDEAVQLIESARETARAGRDTTAWIDALLTRGRFLKTTDDPAGAAELMRQAIALSDACGDSSLACAPRRWLGVALTNMGRHEEALAQYERLSSLAAAVGDAEHEAWASVGLGWDADLKRDYELARSRYARAVELFETAGNGEGMLWASLGVANAHFHLGDYREAGAGWSRVADIAQREGNRRHEAVTRNNLAGLQFALGRPDISLREYALAVAVWDSLGQLYERMPPALNLAGCLASVGRVDEAREALQREIATCRTSGFRDFEARALRKLADLEREQGEREAARRLYGEALALGDELPAIERAPVALGLASLHRSAGEHETALAVLDDALALMPADHTSQVRLQLDLARAGVLLALERRDAARRLLAELDERMGDARPRYGMDLELLHADLALAEADTAAARQALESAAALWDDARSLPLDPDWREERGATGRNVFARLGAVTLALDGAEAAFDRLQPFKARTLRERLIGPGAVLSDSTGGATDAADLRRHVLGPDEALLDAYLGADGGLMFLLTAERCRAVRLPPGAELTADLIAWRGMLADPSVPEQERAALTAKLRATLFDALAADLGRAASVVFVPDGALHVAPVGLLFDGGVRWMRSPSSAILHDLRDRQGRAPAGRQEILALTAAADDLAGADWIGRRLADRYAGVTVRRGDQAVPSSGQADLAGFDVLHVAAHVRPDDVNAWQSAVTFGPGDDQQLSAVDVASMQLDARHVVLASCGSAIGRVLSGEGVQGLANAFLASGASAVVASLWPVDDDLTAVFMDHYYGRLAGGADVSAALAGAQAAVRADPATSHPFDWAGFVVIGDGGVQAPLARRDRASRLPLITVAVVVVAAIILRRRSRASG
jgi:tetratricopeptide (TPR) repeat protein